MTEERRLVTILFADVRGSTALGESLDPEDLRALLSRYYAIARDVVGDYGGTIEKFIGDAVMAVFGLPVAHGDDAERALRAALDLRDRVRDDPRLGERLPIRLGVASGEVVARRDAAAGEDFLITGDAVNVAARLEQGADDWAILVAERTATSAGGFRFGPAVGLDAKGKSVPVPARTLLGRADRARRRLPMIGRDADLMQLELVARRAFTERRPFLVSIVAPAGTGKTRLLEALVERLPELAENATVAIAQCLPYGQRLTYWPLRAVMHRLTGTTDDTPLDGLRSKTESWLRERDVADAPTVAGLLLATVGAADLEVVDRTALFGAWRTAVEAAASDGPLALVLEDLHWSSESLLDLIDSLVQPRADLPILVIALARPELLDRRPTWSGGRRNALSLALEPLPAPDVATLVEHLVEGASSDVVDAVVARADGNPFYAGEIARALVEQVGARLDPAAVHEALLRLPDTVQATVLARLDLLEPADRRMLQVGAVFGRAFLPAGVAAVEPSLAAVGDQVGERLLDRDLVRPASQGELAFRHILIREVAYGMLPRAERARLHAGAATWLAARSAGQEDAYAELIAVHAREAATLATALGLDEADALRRSAVDRLMAAAQSASAAGANLESLRHLRAALELATPDRHLELYELMGNTTVHGDMNIGYLTSALSLARASGAPPERLLRIIAAILTFNTRWQGSVAGRPSEAELMVLIDEGRALVETTSDERIRAQFLLMEGFLPFWIRAGGRSPTAEEFARAEQGARVAFEISQRLDDAVLISGALDGIGTVAQMRGDLDGMRAASQQRLEMGDRLPIAERIDAACMLTWAAVSSGDLDGADTVVGSAFKLVLPGQATNWALHLAAWRTLVGAMRGDWDVALAAAAKAHALWVELDSVAAGYAIRGFLAALDIARARRDDGAQAHWREVVEHIASAFTVSKGRRLQAAHAAGDTAAIVAAFEATHDGTWLDDSLERALGFLSDRSVHLDDALLERLAATTFPQARLVHAQLDRARGLAHADVGLLRTALATFDHAGARPAGARVRCELGLLTNDPELVDAGTKVLRQIGDVDQLDRYASLRGA
jgi:class 3 adenylate cyclase